MLLAPRVHLPQLDSALLQGRWGLDGHRLVYPLVNAYIAIEAMAIEIVSFPMKNGDFP